MTGINENTGVIAETIGQEDQYAQRHANSPDAYGNPYDPESLFANSEEPLGYHDHRLFPTLDSYKDAVAGKLSSEEILRIAPRVKGLHATSFGDGGSGADTVASALKYERAGFVVVAPGIYSGTLDNLIG